LSGFGQNYAGSDLFQKNAFGPDRNQDDSGVNFSPLNGRPAAAVEDDKSSLLAQQTRMNNFEHLLDPSLPPSKPVDSLGGANLDQFLPQTVPAPDKIDGASAAPAQPFRSVINPNLGVEDPNAAFRSQVNVDPTAQALGLPPPVPAPVVTPPKTAQSIEDMLNPYAASVIKRKF
jgi:hypothetical protein